MPNAVVPANPVKVTFAAPVTVSEPMAPVAATPVSATFASAITVNEPNALVPAKPVKAIGFSSRYISHWLTLRYSDNSV